MSEETYQVPEPEVVGQAEGEAVGVVPGVAVEPDAADVALEPASEPDAAESAPEPASDAAPRGPRLTAARLRAFAAFVIIVAVFAGAVAFAVYGPVRVSVDGSALWVPQGTTVADLLRQGRLAGTPGDLLSVKGHLLERHAGGAPTVRIGGVGVGMSTVLAFGSQLRSFHGQDAIEPVVTRVTEIAPGMRYAGSGPVESIEASGVPGVALAEIGAVSGEQKSRRVLSRGTPMTVRREPAWPGRKQVALTFDDGPWPTTTDEVLKELKDAGIKATFFMIGRQVTARPALARRVLAAGMEIGDHSQNHKYLSSASHATITHEIQGGAQSISRVLGFHPRWYRPAGGLTNAFVYREAKRLGLRVVLWTVDPQDWKRPSARTIARRVLDHVRPGSVVLMHDGGGDRSHTVVALQAIIKGLKARGYTMVTLTRLFGPQDPTNLP